MKFFSFISKDVMTMLLIVLFALGALLYRSNTRRKSLLNINRSKPIIWIGIALFISMVMAYVFSGQSFLTSLLAYKVQYLMFGGLALLAVAPTSSEVISSLKIYAIIFTFVYALRLALPSLFNVDNTDSWSAENEINIYGYEMLPLLLYWYGEKYVKFTHIRSLLGFIWIFGLLFMMQNRTTLIPVLLVCTYLMFQVKSKYKWGIFILACMVVVAFVFYTSENWIAQIEQTQSEISNPNYNRIIALNYFLFSGSDNIFKVLFGNGFISAHTSSQMFKLMRMGVYNSDMGFLGYWNQFGIIPIIVFITMIVKIFKGIEFPRYLKFYAFQILLCAPTIMYFGQQSKIICFLLFYYLYEYYKYPANGYNVLNSKIVRK